VIVACYDFEIYVRQGFDPFLGELAFLDYGRLYEMVHHTWHPTIDHVCSPNVWRMIRAQA
jgi:hypothetical protein